MIITIMKMKMMMMTMMKITYNLLCANSQWIMCSNAHHKSNYELIVRIASLKLQLHSGAYKLVTIINLQSEGAVSSKDEEKTVHFALIPL